MKFGPFTFQCACLQCNCRSTASARHVLHSSMSWTRLVSDKSIPVAYILVLVLSAVASGYCNLLATSFYPEAQNQLLAQRFNLQQNQAPSSNPRLMVRRK